MIRILALPCILALLTAAQCDAKTITHYESLITGNAPVQFVALEQESNRAWEDEPVAEIVPEPPPCVDYLWRGQWYDCHGNWLRDL
jgi:hypothetical protein